jgi:hypothetical protein
VELTRFGARPDTWDHEPIGLVSNSKSGQKAEKPVGLKSDARHPDGDARPILGHGHDGSELAISRSIPNNSNDGQPYHQVPGRRHATTKGAARSSLLITMDACALGLHSRR